MSWTARGWSTITSVHQQYAREWRSARHAAFGIETLSRMWRRTDGIVNTRVDVTLASSHLAVALGRAARMGRHDLADGMIAVFFALAGGQLTIHEGDAVVCLTRPAPLGGVARSPSSDQA